MQLNGRDSMIMIRPDRLGGGGRQANSVCTAGGAIHVPLLNKFRTGERR